MAFLLVGAGLHTTQTVGLALATDLAPVESRPKVVGLMYVMLLLGMIVSALLFGALLANFSPARLVQVIQGSAVATMVLNIIALWKQESAPARRAARTSAPAQLSRILGHFTGAPARSAVSSPWAWAPWPSAWRTSCLSRTAARSSTSPSATTTKLTATLAVGGLIGFGLASRVLSRGFDPFRMACYGALVGSPHSWRDTARRR